MNFSLNPNDFLSLDNPSKLEEFHEMFAEFADDSSYNEDNYLIRDFICESFAKSIFKMKFAHFMILLDFIKKNKYIFKESDYTPTYFSHLVRQVITDETLEPDFTPIISEMFNPDRFFISHYDFVLTLNNEILHYLELATLNKDHNLLQAFFSHKYTIDYFYDYKKDILLTINKNIAIPAIRIKLSTHNF